MPEYIQTETGTQAGALALMAYALDELYQASQANGDHRLTFAAYQAVGGVAGAIGERAETTFEQLTLPDKDQLLQHVFRELVAVDERGTATWQRAVLSRFAADERELIRRFVDARLLVTEQDTVEVAHEAVFRSWPRLRAWIAEAQEDLILLRQVRAAAEEWERHGQPDFLRWPAERLKPVYAMIERQQPPLTPLEAAFIEPEQERLLREIGDIRTDHQRRRWIGERLATIGDLRSGIGLDERGLPQIDWLLVSPGGAIQIENQKFSVQPFYVGRYLITHLQFDAFLNAVDGFEDDRWWQGFPANYIKQQMSSAVAQYDNYPRDSVSWYQAVAFTRWLNFKYQEHGLFDSLRAAVGQPEIRLPTEWEWQWMAQNGADGREFLGVSGMVYRAPTRPKPGLVTAAPPSACTRTAQPTARHWMWRETYGNGA